MVAFRGIVATVGELLRFLLERRRLWILPMVVLLLLFAGLIILGNSAGIGPFIYTLF